MSRYNVNYHIVICVTGSIAAYKSCELVSYLVKKGHCVKVIMSHHAEKFVGSVSLEALSRNPVWVEDFKKPIMNHIELGRWCDVCLVYPATAQTINSLASGTGSEPINSFFLAYDFSKPFMIAPAMNTRMLQNPVTQKSMAFLHQMGCDILPSEGGDLACGEIGEGRLFSPEETGGYLLHCLGGHHLEKMGQKPKNILITAGGTRESIDGVRVLTNISTGATGARLADELHQRGHRVWLLMSRGAKRPHYGVQVKTYEDFNDIYDQLRSLSLTQKFDMILHAAAISDYSIGEIRTPDGLVTVARTHSKIPSQHGQISIQLKRNKKILPHLKDIFGEQTLVVGFKLTVTEKKEEQNEAIFQLFSSDTVDYVIHNNIKDVERGKSVFLWTSEGGEQKSVLSMENLVQEILRVLSMRRGDVEFRKRCQRRKCVTR